MADDPIAERCEGCGGPAADRDWAVNIYDCSSTKFSDGVFLQSDQCKIRALTAERDRLRVMAGLLEKPCATGEFWLPNGKTVWLADESETGWRVMDNRNYDSGIAYHTARAAIEAGMGWTEGNGE